ncbi:hypothetical protein [Flagellimonas allohymeniacidonis]|uniref:Lipoprotein n=1 Tax=Flagellimonas allohymeniacidonis TaxID=2517819 RepID=A0A4Q8QED5_9FLAO|nr:hypothetical protein [Allomuricauda hymeniacidonis]TAI48801.1 hypothetical protein EW142_03105 [Allomuricauda hymeniacidonis]
MNKLLRKIPTLLVLGTLMVLTQACSEDAEPVGGDIELSQTELQTILDVDDAAGVADQALTELFANSGAATKGLSLTQKNDCYSAEYSQSGFVATFNNCVLNGTDNVNGTLIVTYEVGNESAAFTATYQDFFVGTLKINGTRSYTLTANAEQNAFFFNVTSEISVEFEDGNVISENGTKTFGLIFGDTIETTSFTLSGSWTVTANGNTYAIESDEDLEGNFGCEHFTSGSMDVEKNGLTVNVDFGDGECDDKATLTYPNGATEELTL